MSGSAASPKAAARRGVRAILPRHPALFPALTPTSGPWQLPACNAPRGGGSPKYPTPALFLAQQRGLGLPVATVTEGGAMLCKAAPLEAGSEMAGWGQARPAQKVGRGGPP